MSCAMTGARPTCLLDLPVEIRYEIFSHLLDVARIPCLMRFGRRYYDLDVALLRVSRQIYSEAWDVLRDNMFVKVLCVGPEDFAPGRLLPSFGARATATKQASIAVAEVDVEVQASLWSRERADWQMILLRDLRSYFTYLAARQIVWCPSSIPEYRQALPNGDSWWIRYVLRVLVRTPTKTVHISNDHGRLDHARLRREERSVLQSLQNLRHCDNVISIVSRDLHDLKVQMLLQLHSPQHSVENWLGHVLEITKWRKDQMDELYERCGNELLESGADLLFEYRNICLDLQYCAESCELLCAVDGGEAMGSHRASFITSLCAAFYSYVCVYRYHKASDSQIWSFNQPCGLDRCICSALAQTDNDLEADQPLPDAQIPAPLWYRLQHVATIIHLVEGSRREQEDISAAFLRLATVRRNLASIELADDEYIVHDADVLRTSRTSMATSVDLLDRLKSNLSLYSMPVHFFAADGRRREML